MKIAVIGSGISGLTCAYLLQQHHDITVFESADRIGGHTATIDLQHRGRQYSIDTGFVVYNDWTYPNFIKLLDKLGVASQPTEMSFSVSCRKTGLEYGGNNLNSLFAQRRNLINFSYLRMLRDILRFNREAVRDLDGGRLSEATTLGEYLRRGGYSGAFASHYLIPMGSAIWSSSLQDMLGFPLLFFVRFFKNHGLLNVSNRPQWRVIRGGSKAYLAPLTEGFADRLQTKVSIASVRRYEDGVSVLFANASQQRFDQVVFACHSDQALALLADGASTEERDVLAAIAYRRSRVMLHTDASILPRARRAWSSWNYHLGQQQGEPPALSYNMNILQGIDSEDTFIVTLNSSDVIDSKKILGQYRYSHPIFTLDSIAAQQRWQDINGVRRSWFCGAYWRNGFHEDGCVSGIRVAQALGATW